MERRAFVRALSGLALDPRCARGGMAADWAWSGDYGPDHWGAMPAYAAGSTGSKQSPIDIAGAIESALPPLGLAWQKANATIVNPGYTIRVDMPSGERAPFAAAPAGLLPRARSYWYHVGSLTTLACAEIATWIVLREPVAAAQADIERFKALCLMSARPLQPRNRRLVLMSG